MAKKGLTEAPSSRLAVTNQPVIRPELVRRVVAGFSLALDGPHGPLHWARVMENGRQLAARMEGVSRKVIDLFALLHDSQRQAESGDPWHGRRAAAFARHLWEEGLLDLDAPELATLEHACCWHSASRRDGDAVVRACWDADRLDLGRVGLMPRREWLCTNAARDEVVFEWAAARGRRGAVAEALGREWSLHVANGHLTHL